MAKKVLIISASPRTGGNSDLLCDQFKRERRKRETRWRRYSCRSRR